MICRQAAIFLFILALATGCFKGTAYLIAETDPEYSPSRTGLSFCVYKPEGATVAEKKLVHALKVSMQDQGFKMAETYEYCQVMATILKDRKIYEKEKISYIPVFSGTSGKVGEIKYSENTTMFKPFKRVIESLHYHVNVDFYRVKRTEASDHPKLDQIWRGFIDIQAGAFEWHPQCVVYWMLTAFGHEDRSGWANPKEGSCPYLE